MKIIKDFNEFILNIELVSDSDIKFILTKKLNYKVYTGLLFKNVKLNPNFKISITEFFDIIKTNNNDIFYDFDNSSKYLTIKIFNSILDITYQTPIHLQFNNFDTDLIGNDILNLKTVSNNNKIKLSVSKDIIKDIIKKFNNLNENYEKSNFKIKQLEIDNNDLSNCYRDLRDKFNKLKENYETSNNFLIDHIRTQNIKIKELEDKLDNNKNEFNHKIKQLEETNQNIINNFKYYQQTGLNII